MSVQLILYPQEYNGYAYTSQSIFSEYVAAGNFSGGLDSVTATSTLLAGQEAMTFPISAWKGWNSTGYYATVSAPSVNASGLTLQSSGSAVSSTGVYQLIGGLQSGASYEIKLDVTTFTSGTLIIGNRWSTSWNANSQTWRNLGNAGATSKTSTSVSGGQITHTFTALGQPDNEVLVIEYVNSNGDNLVISNVSIQETQQSAPVIFTDLADGQVICDLYEDEAIPLTLSIDDFKNVAEKTQSYSKDFHLPNTKRNNKIFGHIFDVQRSQTGFAFNPYVKTKAILKEDSYLIFEGFLQLIDINDKEGEISYNVNLYSEPVTLKDVLENQSFADIDFTELQHDYTITNIKNSWDNSTGLEVEGTLTSSSAAYDSTVSSPSDHTNVLKYPFVNWKGDFNLDALGNIGLLNLEQVFRPFIQLRYLIKRIINEAGFEFTSTFFDTSDFKKLFMDFNWGQGLGSSEVFESFNFHNNNETIIYAGTSFTELEVGNVFSENPTGIAATYISGNTFTATNNNTFLSFSYDVKLYNADSSTRTYDIEWQHYDASAGTTTSIDAQSGSIAANTSAGIGTAPSNETTYNGYVQLTLDDNDTLKCVFKSDVTNKVFQGNNSFMTLNGIATQFVRDSFFVFHLTSIQVAASSLLHAIRGEINQWEFLRGVFAMFNLVVLKEDEILRIEPYADIFINNANSTQHDWTEKVDVSEINLKPLELARKTKFTYEDDENDYSLNTYKRATSGYLYGTKEFDGSTATPNQMSNLTGEEEIIATPFAPTLIRPATELFDTDLTIPHIYSGNDDGTEFEDFENLPRILYNIGVRTLPSKNYVVPQQNSVGQSTENTFLQFAHLSEIPTSASTIDYNFGESQLIQPIGNTPSDNLYNTYYSPYYDELYNADTRVMTMKVNLSPADIQSFRFYDTVIIKNREYRVNKIEYKPNTLARVEFILIP